MATDRYSMVSGQYEPVLTGLAQGYIGNKYCYWHLFPEVPVPARKIKIPFFGKELFRIIKSKRAPRAQSNRMVADFRDTQTYELSEWDLYDEIDVGEIEESLQNEKEHSSAKVQEAIFLGIEAECAEMAQNSENYPEGNVVTLSGTDQFSDAASKPNEVAQIAHDTIRQKTGKRPNTLILGAKTLEALENHPQIIGKIQYVQEAFPTVEHLKKFFKVEKIVTGESIYFDPGLNKFVDLWGDVMIFAYVSPGVASQGTVNKKDLSFGYTFRKKEMPRVDSFWTNPNKVLAIRNTDIVESYIVGPECGYLVLDTVA